ncbi:MAG: hypothetical protein D3923_12060, partial [Candidatus Electrothrix sp. AR3]|nr:hypothetical protein [Candidatus Electrothrix sp. AR3]
VSENREIGLLAKIAGEFYDLRRHIILKAKEAGPLLQLPKIIVEFAKDCGVKYEQKEICIRKQKGVPYRHTSFACSEKS